MIDTVRLYWPAHFASSLTAGAATKVRTGRQRHPTLGAIHSHLALAPVAGAATKVRHCHLAPVAGAATKVRHCWSNTMSSGAGAATKVRNCSYLALTLTELYRTRQYISTMIDTVGL